MWRWNPVSGSKHFNCSCPDGCYHSQSLISDDTYAGLSLLHKISANLSQFARRKGKVHARKKIQPNQRNGYSNLAGLLWSKHLRLCDVTNPNFEVKSNNPAISRCLTTFWRLRFVDIFFAPKRSGLHFCELRLENDRNSRVIVHNHGHNGGERH